MIIIKKWRCKLSYLCVLFILISIILPQYVLSAECTDLDSSDNNKYFIKGTARDNPDMELLYDQCYNQNIEDLVSQCVGDDCKLYEYFC